MYQEINFNGGGGNPAKDQHVIHGGVEILLIITSCHRNWDKWTCMQTYTKSGFSVIIKAVI